MFCKVLWKILHFGPRAWHFIERKLLQRMILSCGKNVTIPADIKLHGYNVEIGNDVLIGEGAVFMCALAPIRIGDHVLFGPNVTVVTGDHRMDCVGKYIFDVGPEDKLPENDLPVVFAGDNWIGANSTILKGVTIGEGAVVAAGSLVTKDVAPYTVVGGVPAKKLKDRFTEQELQQHLQMLRKDK